MKVGHDVGTQQIERHGDGCRRLVGHLLERGRPGQQGGKLLSRRHLRRTQQRADQLRRIGKRRRLGKRGGHRPSDGLTVGAKRFLFNQGDAARPVPSGHDPVGLHGQPDVLVRLAYGERAVRRSAGQASQFFSQAPICADGQGHRQHAGDLGVDDLVPEFHRAVVAPVSRLHAIHSSKINLSRRVVNGRENQSGGVAGKHFAPTPH